MPMLTIFYSYNIKSSSDNMISIIIVKEHSIAKLRAHWACHELVKIS